MDVPLALAAVILLVAANGFFVATEFALVSVRRTRVEQLAAEGSSGAHSVLDALDHLDTYIAATQLGITMASLALGWIGEPAISQLIDPIILAIPFLSGDLHDVASHTISAVFAFGVITTLHIVFGELAPKSIALQRAESTALLVTRPIHWFSAVFHLPIRTLNGIGNAVVHLVGIQPAAGHAMVQSAEELKLSVAASRAAGLVNPVAQDILDRALDFSRLQVTHVMVPRPEIVAVHRAAPIAEIVALFQRHQCSRYPVFETTIDDIVGVVSAKRLLAAVAEASGDSRPADIREYLDPPMFVPEGLPAYQLLAQMREGRRHFAIAVDEYGTTAGLVTLRDLIDYLAGELPDESEVGPAAVVWLPDGSALVDGLIPIPVAEQELRLKLAGMEYDTLGGLVFGEIGRRPQIGDSVTVGDRLITVEELDGLRVARLRVRASE